MKKNVLTTIVIMFLINNLTIAQKKQTEKTTLKTWKDTISYIIGRDIGNNLKQSKIDINIDILCKGLAEEKNNQPSLFTQMQVDSIMNIFRKEMMQKQQDYQKQAAASNIQKGKEFLEENKKKPGVITTNSGLQYKIIKEGNGPSPTPTDKVKVHYHGTLIDGTVFDSSVQRGEPITFALNQVIPGWTEGLQLMKVGSKYIFYIPHNLAYGEREIGAIPPGSTLIFEVELLDIVK